MRWAKNIERNRQKNIVRLRTVKYVHVHTITGTSVRVDPDVDMVMVHFKLGQRETRGTRIVPNPFVDRALSRSLFCFCLFQLFVSLFERVIAIS